MRIIKFILILLLLASCTAFEVRDLPNSDKEEVYCRDNNNCVSDIYNYCGGEPIFKESVRALKKGERVYIIKCKDSKSKK